MGFCPSIERLAMPVESPSQRRIFAKPSGAGQIFNVQSEFPVRGIGPPETVVAAEIGQAAIDAHSRSGTNQYRVRSTDRLGGTPHRGFSRFRHRDVLGAV